MNVVPFGVDSYDNPETIRFRKYATGAHILLQEAPVHTGQTPREVVWKRDKARLYHYQPDVEKRFPVPVLLVYALILRPYILDLVPGNSFVEYLCDEGFDVYLLDWGIPDDEDRRLSFEGYVLDYMPEAVEQVSGNSRTGGATLLGHCQGGTMSAMYAALSPGVVPENLILFATPTDFAPETPGLFGLWTIWSRNSERFVDPDLLTEAFGNFPADLPSRLIDAGTAMLALPAGRAGPYRNPWSRAARAVLSDSFLAASKWVDDSIPFPGEAFRQWIRDFYQHNRLARGEFELRGRRVNLSDIECPVLNIAGRKDYICPLSQAETTMNLVGSRDKEFLTLDAGHVGLMCGPKARRELWPRIRDWLEPRSK